MRASNHLSTGIRSDCVCVSCVRFRRTKYTDHVSDWSVMGPPVKYLVTTRGRAQSYWMPHPERMLCGAAHWYRLVYDQEGVDGTKARPRFCAKHMRVMDHNTSRLLGWYGIHPSTAMEETISHDLYDNVIHTVCWCD